MSEEREELETVGELMASFAERTGLSSEDRAPRRYLWTDAFAVCNFLELAERTGEAGYRDTALRLVDQVHHTLGRHRLDDPRSGWISGLSEKEGARHPTRGGLRIGKERPERRREDAFDQRLEWERDGQYFHYLTKWMHALARVARATSEPRYLEWAVELAQATYAGFSYVAADGRKRLFWKMSIDLSRPLVPSMGHHDPLDGLLTFRELRSAAASWFGEHHLGNLDVEIGSLEEIAEGADWATADPLGLGGLLTDVWRLVQLVVRGGSTDLELLERLLAASRTGLAVFTRADPLEAPAAHRLAFRELGLAIGLAALPKVRQSVEGDAEQLDPGRRLRGHLERLAESAPLGRRVVEFWRRETNRAVASWREHRDINEVMLATALAPDEFLSV